MSTNENQEPIPVIEAEVPDTEPEVTVDTPNEPEATVAEEQEAKTYVLTQEEFDAVQQHVKALEKEKNDYLSLLQHNQADFENYRRRNNNARAESFEDGRRAVVKELLTVLDNFDRAMEADASAADAWQDGMRMVYRQLGETLKKLGLSEIPTEGAFDPRLHNAVLSETVEGKESGEILLVLLKGYKLGEAILRHSMVKVNN